MLQQLDGERQDAGRLVEEAKAQANSEIRKIDLKLDRLTTAYLDAGAFSATEFRKRKQEAITGKRKLLDKPHARNRSGEIELDP